MSECDRKHVDGCAIFYRSFPVFHTLLICNMGSESLNDVLAGHQSLCLWKSSWWNLTSWPLSTQMDMKTCSTGTHWNGRIIVFFFINNLLSRVMTKDNIALAALLQTKEACWEGGVPPDHKVFLFVCLVLCLFCLFVQNCWEGGVTQTTRFLFVWLLAFCWRLHSQRELLQWGNSF